MIRSIKNSFLVLLSAVALGACQGTKGNQGDMQVAAINSTCPIMGDHDVDPDAKSVTYEGHTIGFCCDKCVGKWESWSDEKKAAYVTDAMKMK